MNGPLAHVRAVEITDLRGAMAGRILADLGADVIKIEPPAGERDRWRPPFARDATDGGGSLPFLYRNANKRGAVADLESADGRAFLDRLLGTVDVLIENLGAEEQRRLRLEPSDLLAEHPALVIVSLSDFGLSGPKAHWRAEPLVAFAASGALFTCGFPDLAPCWLPGYAAHDCAAVFGAVGAVAALMRRVRSRQGCWIEVSAQEAGMSGLYPWAIPIADYQHLYPMIPSSPPRMADGAFVVLPTRDGYVRFVLGTPRHWQGFLELIGRPEELAGPQWEHPIYRLLSADTIRDVAGGALRERPRVQVLARARELGVPIAPVNRPEEFVEEEQTRERGFFLRTGFRVLGEAPFAGAPFKFSRTPAAVRRPAPLAGEHQGEVVEEIDRWGASHGLTVGLAERPVEAGQILAGTRVIDLGVGAVGPECCSLLAELGADVIKIESRANLDFLRKASPDPGEPNRAWVFNTECRGQKSVAINLGTDRGREVALRLLACADVVVENNRGGVVEAWGLDYERVKEVNPGVVYLSSQGYGKGGPLGTASAFGPLNSAFSGANYLWNHPAAPYPAGSTLNHPDHVASKLAAVAVLAALEHKRRTGEGQFIDMSQAEVAAYLLGEFYLEGPLAGVPPSPPGNRVPYAAPHGVYRCRGDDRWVAVAVLGEAQWRRFVSLAGRGHWAEDPRFTDLPSRLRHQDELDRLVEEWTSGESAEEVARLLQEAGISASVVQNGDDHRADPHLLARGAIVAVEHPEVGRERHVANALRIDGAPVDGGKPAPCLGAHTSSVLSELLGLNEEEIARLIEEKVLW